jgi:hypothetical protein
MKPYVIAAGLLTATVLTSLPAAAQNYPWCASYGGRDGGGTNCGFVTREQCMATISGMGGFCDLNTQYVPPPGPAPRYRARHRHHKHS